jgi:hypothetical protein
MDINVFLDVCNNFSTILTSDPAPKQLVYKCLFDPQQNLLWKVLVLDSSIRLQKGI